MMKLVAKNQHHRTNLIIELKIRLVQDGEGKNVKAGDLRGLITFKNDGERFKLSNKTLKLATNCKYKIVISTKPVEHLESFSICDTRVKFAPSDTVGQYDAFWETHEKTENRPGTRENIALEFQVKEGKFYDYLHSHLSWGAKLEHITLHCIYCEPTDCWKVTEQEFRIESAAEQFSALMRLLSQGRFYRINTIM
uniref:CB1 cannabinoid receptor-interacting protein 1 n=1 Tax=Romanomermis culicivorax TaxID=13658 RepID=A0A915L3L1_ROMCU